MAEFGSQSNNASVEFARLDRWALSIVISVGFVAWVIWGSQKSGTLALPPTYDDVEYFRDAARRLNLFETSGLVAFVQNYLADPPHSLMATCLGMIGFWFFGLHPWAALSVNSIFVMLLVRVFLGATRHLPIYVGVALLLGLLLNPFLAVFVLEFRPDPAAAIFTACGCALLIFQSNQIRSAWWAGICLAVALLAKTTIFYLTGLLFAVAFVLSSLDSAFRFDWRTIWARLWRFSVITFAIAGFHYGVAADHILSYIYSVIWGDTSAVWQTPMPTYKQIAYYLVGAGGRFGHGALIYVAPFLVLISFKLAQVRSISSVLKDPITHLISVAGVAWAFVSFAPIKSQFLGLSVSAFVLVLTAVAVIRISVIRKHWAVPMALVLFLIGLVDYKSVWERRYGPFPPADYVASRFEALNNVVETLAGRSDIAQSKVQIPIWAPYLNEATLDFALQQRGIFNRVVHEDIASTNPAAYKTRSDYYLVAITSDNRDIIRFVPSGKIAEQINAVIASDTSLENITSFPDKVQGGEIQIYQKK